MNQQQNSKVLTQKSCIVQGHQKEIANHICILNNCDLSNRWICIKCALDDKHIHGQQNKDHLIDEDIFNQLLQTRQEYNQKQNKEKSSRLEYFLKKLKDYAQDMNLIIQQLENEYKALDANKSILFVDELIQTTKDNFSQISNEQIGQFIKDNNFFTGYFYQNFKQEVNEIFKNIEKIKSDIDQNYGEQAIKVQQTQNNQVQNEQIIQKVPPPNELIQHQDNKNIVNQQPSIQIQEKN